MSDVHDLRAIVLTSSGSSSSSSGLLNIQSATVEFGPPKPSWRATSSTDARTILESRFWDEADDADDDKDFSSRRCEGRVDAMFQINDC